jgi:hypothetical protein
MRKPSFNPLFFLLIVIVGFAGATPLQISPACALTTSLHVPKDMRRALKQVQAPEKKIVGFMVGGVVVVVLSVVFLGHVGRITEMKLSERIMKEERKERMQRNEKLGGCDDGIDKAGER